MQLWIWHLAANMSHLAVASRTSRPVTCETDATGRVVRAAGSRRRRVGKLQSSWNALIHELIRPYRLLQYTAVLSDRYVSQIRGGNARRLVTLVEPCTRKP